VERINLLEEVNTVMQKYSELYNFAPFGYVTLSENNEIQEFNKSASLILGFGSYQPLQKEFRQFISEKSYSVYDQFLEKVYTSSKKQVCEIEIQLQNGEIKYILMEGVVFKTNDKCLLTLVDITKRKLDELELQKKTEQLTYLNGFFVDRELKMVELKNKIKELSSTTDPEKESN